MCVHVGVLIVYSYVSVYNVSINACACTVCMYVYVYCMYTLMGEDVCMYVCRYVHIMHESLSTWL